MNSPNHSSWQPAPRSPHLRAGEVHLWRANLADTDPELSTALSPAEWIRAGRFHFERDRQRFIATRGIVRTILSRYLDMDAGELAFTLGEHGKPALDGVCSTLRFNLSHSDDLLLVAVSHMREVDVDVEFMRPDVPFEALADHYFAPEDAWKLRLLPPAEKAWQFYELWTRAEARLKASGRGLSGANGIIEPDRWSLRRVSPAEGYAAALVVEGGEFQLDCWSWQN